MIPGFLKKLVVKQKKTTQGKTPSLKPKTPGVTKKPATAKTTAKAKKPATAKTTAKAKKPATAKKPAARKTRTNTEVIKTKIFTVARNIRNKETNNKSRAAIHSYQVYIEIYHQSS